MLIAQQIKGPPLRFASQEGELMDKDEFNILIVDDEVNIRESLKIILETEGYTGI